MQIDKLGLPKYGTDDLMDLIYKGKEDLLFNVLADDNDETKKFNKSLELTGTGQQLKFYKSLDIDLKSFDKLLQNEWFMPNSYKSFDIETYVRSICPDNQNSINRVKEELEAFKEMGYINLLRFLHYLVNFMKENNIIWGVGRGSSVASYVLFLLGVHKIDSLQYNLNWREFLR